MTPDHSAEDLLRETVRNLIRDLHQPLSSMEAIAYYLEMTLPPEQIQSREHLQWLQQLVEETNAILQHAISYIRQCGATETEGVDLHTLPESGQARRAI